MSISHPRALNYSLADLGFVSHIEASSKNNRVDGGCAKVFSKKPETQPRGSASIQHRATITRKNLGVDKDATISDTQQELNSSNKQ